MPLLKPPEPQIAMRKVANQFFSPRSGAQILKSQYRRAAPVSGEGLEAFQQTLSEYNSGSSVLGLANGYVSSVVTGEFRAVELRATTGQRGGAGLPRMRPRRLAASARRPLLIAGPMPVGTPNARP